MTLLKPWIESKHNYYYRTEVGTAHIRLEIIFISKNIGWKWLIYAPGPVANVIKDGWSKTSFEAMNQADSIAIETGFKLLDNKHINLL